MGVIRRVAPEPCHVAGLRHGAGDHQEFVFGKPCHGEIGLDAAALIEPLGVNDAARLDVDIVGADAVQHLAGIAALDGKFGEARLIEEGAIGHQPFGLVVGARKPVLAAIAVFVFRFDAAAGIPVGPFPAIDFAEYGAELLGLLVDGRAAHAARCLSLAIGPVHGIEKAQTLACPVMRILAHRLEGMDAADVHGVHIHGRMAVLDPLRQHEAGAARSTGCRSN